MLTPPLGATKPRELPVWDVMLAVALPVAAVALGVVWWATTRMKPPPPVVRKSQEVFIGKFNCRNGIAGRAASGEARSTAAVDCVVSAVVETGERSVLEMEDRLDQYRARLREIVEISIRHTSHEELQDPELTAARSRLRDGFNALLGNGTVKEVVIDNWRAYTIPHAAE